MMRWRLNLHPKHTTINITIEAQTLTEEIQKLTNYIDQLTNTMIVQEMDEQIEIQILDMVYIENIERKTFIYTLEDMYEMEAPLYEMEERLQAFNFLRINKQTIINPRHVQAVKALLNSRYELCMASGEKLIVTRHYRASFKSLFDKGGMYDA